MQRADPRAPTRSASAELVHDAFRQLHGTRLHGFALLLTLGDRRRAALLTAEALAAAEANLASLRHPERAAAWLRAHVVRHAGRDDRRVGHRERMAALADLGVGRTAYAGLEALSRLERAGLVAVALERLDLRDVATIVGIDGERLDGLLRRARRHYLDAAALDVASPEPPGPISRRVAASVARTLT